MPANIQALCVSLTDADYKDIYLAHQKQFLMLNSQIKIKCSFTHYY